MAKTLRLSADQREDLVAYLDGELPDVKAQEIDKVLSRSEVARFEVEALARTWELLDILPTPKAPPEFIERTMTTLKVAETPFEISDQPWFKPLKRVMIAVVWIAFISVSGWLGFRVTNEWIVNSSRQMLEDLPTLQSLDLYQEVESIDFLKKLKASQLFDDIPDPGQVAFEPNLTAAKSINERYQVVVKMPDVERKRLVRNQDAFRKMDAEKQWHYRQLQEMIDADRKDERKLSGILQTYGAWLQTLTPNQREELRQASDSASKLALVRRFKEEQYHRVEHVPIEVAVLEPRRPNPVGPRPLSQSDLNNVMKVLVAELPEEDHEKFARLNKPEQYVEILRRNVQHAANPKAWPSAELQEKILNALPQSERSMVKKNPQNQRAMILMLLRFSLVDQVFKVVKKLPDDAELDQTQSELDEKHRSVLEKKNPDERRRELVRKFLEKHDPKTLKHLQTLTSDLNHVMTELGMPEFGRRGKEDHSRGGEPPGRENRSLDRPGRAPSDKK